MHSEANNLREVAERFARSLRSDLHAFIIDKNIIDPGVVDRIILVSGVDRVIRKAVMGDTIVYYISPFIVRRRCQHQECRDVPKEHQKACIDRCTSRMIESIAEEASKSILEAIG